MNDQVLTSEQLVFRELSWLFQKHHLGINRRNAIDEARTYSNRPTKSNDSMLYERETARNRISPALGRSLVQR